MFCTVFLAETPNKHGRDTEIGNHVEIKMYICVSALNCNFTD